MMDAMCFVLHVLVLLFAIDILPRFQGRGESGVQPHWQFKLMRLWFTC